MPEHHTHSDKHEAHRRLIARLRQQADDITRISAGLDEASLAKRTIPDKWSLKELVCHLHRVQQVFEGRIASMLAQDNPAITVYSPDDDAEFEKMLSRPSKDALPEAIVPVNVTLGSRLIELAILDDPFSD